MSGIAFANSASGTQREDLLLSVVLKDIQITETEFDRDFHVGYSTVSHINNI